MKKLLAVLACLAIPLTAQAAGFDCAMARSVDEKAVCADPRLSELDSLVGTAFGQLKPAVRTPIARGFLAERRSCAADIPCLMSQYVAVLGSYRDAGATVAIPPWVSAPVIAGTDAPASVALPTRIGQCGASEVTAITPRLDFGRPPIAADFDSGTAVAFRNGGYQVSYEREAALLESRPGDKVVMCLIGIPHDCPPGDQRGRFYAVTNLRTQATWSLPDAEHSCGGA